MDDNGNTGIISQERLDENKKLEKTVTTKDTTKKLPNDFGSTVMEFAKISTDAYRSGSLVGQITVLKEVQNDIQRRIDKLQDQYDQTDVGAVMKKVKDG